jgi:hypothetical protein
MPSKNAQSASPTKSAATGPKLPVKNLRLGRIKAAVWENETDQKKFYNVTFARTYMDDAKTFHDTDSFGRDDLPLVAKLADQGPHVHLRTARGTEIRAERIIFAPNGRPEFSGRLFCDRRQSGA